MLVVCAGTLTRQGRTAAGVQQELPEPAGDCPSRAHGHPVRDPRRDQGPQRRAARRQHAGGQRVGQSHAAPGGARSHRVACRCAQARPRRSDRAPDPQRQQGISLPPAPHESVGCGGRRRPARSRRAPAPRIPPLLPGRRSHGAPARFTNIDDVGQEGLELAFNTWLQGVPGRKKCCATGWDGSWRTSRASSRPGRGTSSSAPSTCASSISPTAN